MQDNGLVYQKGGVKYLIVTADDLGLAKSINEGIAKACQEGIVTAVSVIPTGKSFEDAVKIIKDLRLKEIGAHLALTETKPLLAGSRFCKNYNQFFFNLSVGNIRENDIYQELKAQLELLKSTGIAVTHINGHEHIQMMPKIMNIFIRLAKEYNIPAIRFPRGDREPKKLSLKENYKSILLRYLSGKTEAILNKSGLKFTDSFLGLLDSGRLTEKSLLEILNSLKDGVTELVCHPGFLSPEVLDSYSWHIGGESEIFALTSNRAKIAIKNNDIKLISYQEFLAIR